MATHSPNASCCHWTDVNDCTHELFLVAKQCGTAGSYRQKENALLGERVFVVFFPNVVSQCLCFSLMVCDFFGFSAVALSVLVYCSGRLGIAKDALAIEFAS